jgi:hypothetical protein
MRSPVPIADDGSMTKRRSLLITAALTLAGTMAFTSGSANAQSITCKAWDSQSTTSKNPGVYETVIHDVCISYGGWYSTPEPGATSGEKDDGTGPAGAGAGKEIPEVPKCPDIEAQIKALHDQLTDWNAILPDLVTAQTSARQRADAALATKLGAYKTASDAQANLATVKANYEAAGGGFDSGDREVKAGVVIASHTIDYTVDLDAPFGKDLLNAQAEERRTANAERDAFYAWSTADSAARTADQNVTNANKNLTDGGHEIERLQGLLGTCK